jgi:UDP-N-acetylmuramoylalanine--D-glutamate ligase
MKTLIVGLGKSGLAAYELLEREGGEVVGVDDNPNVMAKSGKRVNANPRLEEFDQVVISPGVSPTHRLYKEALRFGKKIIGEAELAFSRLHQPAIAITGTNGKTTVTLLIEHVLKACGKLACALGNVGTPISSYLKELQPHEIVVAELSSFQLETLNQVVFDAGVVLNITPDHLDRYDSMRQYAKAKCQLQKLIKPKGTLWVHQAVADEYGDLLEPGFRTYGPNSKSEFWTDRQVIREGDKVLAELPMHYQDAGSHESENVLAAYLLCQTFGIEGLSFTKAVASFKKPAHRIEFIDSIGGVDYINDSKGTNIDATMKAVEMMTGPVILIAGGVDKGATYQPWISCFKGKVKHMIVIGEAASKIEEELGSEFPMTKVATLDEAVHLAKAQAIAGDKVLLSPGCSSYDMFRDYVHRGEEFRRIVKGEKR